jgi:uncharacterized protein YdhG (YjbR/CyaY superfamily)
VPAGARAQAVWEGAKTRSPRGAKAAHNQPGGVVHAHRQNRARCARRRLGPTVLAQVSESDLTKLHGMGTTAIAALREALHERGLSFHAGVPASDHLHGVAGSPGEVDEYLRGVEEPGRSTLQTLRRTILEIVPDAEQVISYRVPAFRVRGETVAGFAAFKNHLSYLPFSGSVLSQLADELDGYAMTKSSLHFPVDRPLPKVLVKKLIAVRLAQVGGRSR